MKILAGLREKAYWLTDSIRGGTVRAAYDDIAWFDCHDSMCSAAIEKREAAWKRLKDAASHTQFYKKFIDGDLTQFPVIDKNVVRNDYDAFLSDL